METLLAQATKVSTINPKYHSTKENPIIEKIELTESQKGDIKRIMEGKPSEKTIERLEARNFNVEKYLKSRNPESKESRMKKVIQTYFGGYCHVCSQFPDYKVTYAMDGITLMEYFCEKHKEDWRKK